MLSTIQFDDETAFVTNEVHEIGLDRLLTTKLVTGKPPIAKTVPEKLLGICRSLA
ncbi:MAG TPA: hypothetical protein VNX47_13725 [Nevskia sp.]|nr:hypothetical protein [Nevskia sp.]